MNARQAAAIAKLIARMAGIPHVEMQTLEASAVGGVSVEITVRFDAGHLSMANRLARVSEDVRHVGLRLESAFTDGLLLMIEVA